MIATRTSKPLLPSYVLRAPAQPPDDIALHPLGGGKYVLELALTRAALAGFANPVTLDLGLGSDVGRIATNAIIFNR